MRAGAPGSNHDQVCGTGTGAGALEHRIGVAVFDTPLEADGVETSRSGDLPGPLLVRRHLRHSGVFEKTDGVDGTDLGTERDRERGRPPERRLGVG